MFFGLSIFGVYTHRQHSSQNVSLLRVSATSYRLEVSMIPLQGAFRKYRRGFFFSARGRRFDLAVLNIVWLRVYVLDSPMRDWFNKAAWQKARDPPPPVPLWMRPGSRMTSHDWCFLLSFFLELVAQRTSIDHHVTPWGVFASCIHLEKRVAVAAAPTSAFNFWSSLRTVRGPLREVK